MKHNNNDLITKITTKAWMQKKIWMNVCGFGEKRIQKIQNFDGDLDGEIVWNE